MNNAFINNKLYDNTNEKKGCNISNVNYENLKKIKKLIKK
jgi:hypothetical protein